MRDSLVRCLLATLWITTACRGVPVVNYPIPPGRSASFPPSELEVSAHFQEMFCSVLAEKAFANDGWKECNKYVLMRSASEPQQLSDLPTTWTLLLVGGFGAQCFAPDVVAFKDAAEHLREVHQVQYHAIDVAAFGSSEENAKKIADSISALPEQHFIVLAHSKGAADVMVGMSTYPTAFKKVDALITVAGAVGGSWLADDFARLNETVIKQFNLPTCLPAARVVQNGIDSMRRQNRQDYLAMVPHSWRAFSISAVSQEQSTSKVLLPLWRRLRPYALEQDSHIIEREAIVPGGTFLGRALGDHWAVAMPFDPNPKVPQRALKIIDKNRFPRAPLIEAAVRAAIASLK